MPEDIFGPVTVPAAEAEDIFGKRAATAEQEAVGRPLISPEELGLPARSTWGALGEVGVAESFERQGVRQGVIERVPFIGAGFTGKRLYDTYAAAQRIKQSQEEGVNLADFWQKFNRKKEIPVGDQTWGYDQESYAKRQQLAGDLQNVMRFYYEAEMAQERGMTIPAQASQVVADLVPFAIEFMATAGVAGTAKAGAKAGLEKLGKGLAARAVKGTVGMAAGAAVRTALSPGRVASSLINRRLPSAFEIDETGQLNIKETDEGWATSTAKAFGDVFIEMFSEETGEALVKGAKGLGRLAASPFGRIPGALPLAQRIGVGIQEAWSAVTKRPAWQFAKRLAEKAGYHGILGEIGEERLGDVMRAAFNIQDFGTGPDSTILERVAASVPSGRQILVEALAFSVPGAARAGLALALNRRGDPDVWERPEARAAAALLVARDSDSPTLQRYGEKVLTQTVAGEAPEKGLWEKVHEEYEKLIQRREQTEEAAPPAAEAPQPAAPPSAEAVTAPSSQAAAPAIAEEGAPLAPAAAPPVESQAAAPPPVAEGEVGRPAEPLASPLEQPPAAPAAVTEVAPAGAVEAAPRAEEVAPTAEEAPAREPTEEAGAAGEEYAEHLRVEGKEATGRILRAGAAGTYQVRLKELSEEAAEVPLERLTADLLAEMPDGERIQLLKELEAETSIEQVRKVIQQFRAIAPKLAQRSKVPAMWGISGPAPTAEAGGIAAVQVQELYEKYKKLIPSGVLKGLLKDWISWKQLNRAGASPELLRDWVKRHEPRPVRAEYIGEMAQLLTAKQLREYIDSLKGRIDAPTHQVLSAAYRKALTARTPAQIAGVLEAINLAVEKHNHAVAVKDLKDTLKDIERQKLLPEYQKRLDELLAGLSSTTPTPVSAKWATGVLEAAIREGVYTGPLQEDIEAAQRTLAALQGRNIRELTTEQLKALKEAILNVANMDRLKKELLSRGKAKSFAEVLGRAIADVKSRHGQQYDDNVQGRTIRKNISQMLDWAGLSQLSHETMVHILGGNEGALYDLLVRQLEESTGKTAGHWLDVRDEFRAAMEKNGVSIEELEKWSDAVAGKQGVAETVTIQTESGPVTMSVAEGMELLLHSWDMDTLQQLRTSKGFMLERTTREHEVTGEDLERFADQMHEQHPKAYAMARDMQAILNGKLREELNKTWKEHHLYEIATKTDYWPRTRAWKEVGDPNELMRNWRRHFMDDMRIFKERLGTKEAVKVGDVFSTFTRHVNQVSSYAGSAVAHANAVRVLKTPEFRVAILRAMKNGEVWLKYMEEAVQSWAGMQIQDQETAGQLLKKFIRHAHVGVLGLKPQIVAYQVISAINALGEIEGRYLLAGMREGGTGKELLAEMRKYAPTMYLRVTGTGHNIITPGSGRAGLGEFVGQKEGIVGRVGLEPIHRSDTIVINAIWRAAKAEGRAKGLSGEELLTYAGNRSVEIVNRTQPTYDPLTISRLQVHARNNPFLALLMLYRSQSNKNVNMAVRAVADWLYKGDHRLGPLVSKLFLPIVGNSLGVALLAAIYKGLKQAMFAGDDDEDRIARLTKEAAWGTMERTLTQWIGPGDIVNLFVLGVKAAAEGKPPTMLPERQNILASAGVDLMETGYWMTKALAEQDEIYKTGPRKYDSKSEQDWIKAGESASRLASTVLGLPIQELIGIGSQLARKAD